MAKTDDQKNKYEEKTKQLEEKNEELTNNWKRALADYQNLEKRIFNEQQALAKYAGQKILHDLLAVLDILEKAANHLQDRGLTLAVGNFQAVLKENGVTKIEVLGKKFNPLEMECVEVLPSEREDEVIEEVRAGYLLYDKVLRPAQVKVGKKELNQKIEELAKEELVKGDYM